MDAFRLTLAALCLVVIPSCVITPPSADGVSAYQRDAFSQAEAELSPLAERRDRTAQYYMAMMAVRGVLANPISDDTAHDYVLASARSGNAQAYALMLWFQADDPTRQRWADNAEAFSLIGQDAQSLLDIINQKQATSFSLLQDIDTVAGGPVRSSVDAAIITLVRDRDKTGDFDLSLTFSPSDFLAVDHALARQGYKPAQVRLGLKYQDGRGVEQNAEKAYRLFGRAARSTSAPSTCVYQPPVGKAPSSVYCSPQGQAIPGLPRGQYELCKAYAYGIGTDKNPQKAERWCNMVINDTRFREGARDALINLGETDTPG